MTIVRAAFAYSFTGENDGHKSNMAALRYKERDVIPVRLAIKNVTASAPAIEVARVANNLTRYAPRNYPVLVALDFIPSAAFCEEFIECADGIVVPIFQIRLGPVSSWLGDASFLSALDAVRSSGLKVSLSFPLSEEAVAAGDALVAFVRSQIAAGVSFAISLPEGKCAKTAQQRMAKFVIDNGLSYLMDFLTASEPSDRTKTLQDAIVDAELSSPLTKSLEALKAEVWNYQSSIDLCGLRSINKISLSRIS